MNADFELEIQNLECFLLYLLDNGLDLKFVNLKDSSQKYDLQPERSIYLKSQDSIIGKLQFQSYNLPNEVTGCLVRFKWMERLPSKSLEVENILQNYPNSKEKPSDEELSKLHLIEIREHIDEGLYKKALQLCEKALKENPEFAHFWNSMGVIYANLGKDEKAVGYYKKAVELDPHLIRSWINLGNRYKELGERNEAEKCYKHAANANFSLFDAIDSYSKGIAYMELNHYQQAIDSFESALKQKPNNVMGWKNKAVCYEYLERFQDAVHCYKKVLELDPQNKIALKKHNNLVERSIKIEVSESILEKAINHRDLLSARINLEKANILDEHTLHIMQERLDLLYGNTYNLIQTCLNVSDSLKYINNCIRIIALSVDALDKDETQILDFSDATIYSFVTILQEIVVNENQYLKNDIALNFYLIKFFFHIQHYFKDDRHQKQFFHFISELKNRNLINLLFRSIEKLLWQSIDGNEITDNYSVDSSVEKKYYMTNIKDLSDEGKLHYLCDLYIKTLEHREYFQNLSILRIDTLFNHIENYFLFCLKKYEQTFPKDENFLDNCITILYLTNDFRDLQQIAVKFSFYQKLETFIKTYFNQTLFDEIFKRTEDKVPRSVFSNHLNVLSRVFFKIGNGGMGLYLELASYIVNRSYTKVIQRYKETYLFFLDSNYSNPPFEKFRLPDLILSNYLYYIEEHLYLKMDISHSLEEISIYIKEPNLKFIMKNTSYIIQFYSYYDQIFDKSDKIVNHGNNAKKVFLPKLKNMKELLRLDFKFISYDLQFSVCIKMLIYVFDGWDRFVTKWDTLLEDLNASQTKNLIKNTYSIGIQEAFQQFSLIFYFDVEKENKVFLSNDLSILLQEILFFLNQLPYAELKSKLSSENFQLRKNIKTLSEFIVNYFEHFNNFFLLYQLICLVTRYDFFSTETSITDKHVNKICSHISKLIHDYYRMLPIFHWDLRDKNIIDEINVLLEKSKINLIVIQ